MVTSAKTSLTTATTKKRVAKKTEYLMFEISQLDYSVLSYQNNYRISLEIVYKHTSAENIFGIAKLIDVSFSKGNCSNLHAFTILWRLQYLVVHAQVAP